MYIHILYYTPAHTSTVSMGAFFSFKLQGSYTIRGKWRLKGIERRLGRSASASGAREIEIGQELGGQYIYTYTNSWPTIPSEWTHVRAIS